jgi:hypothetical protein
MRGVSRTPPMSWRRNPPRRGVSKKPPMSWRRKLPMGTRRMKSPPLRTRSPETRPTPPRRGGSIDAVGGRGVWAMWGKPPTWENWPSGMADKEIEERGKEGGSVLHDATKREAGERRDDESLLDKPLLEPGVE